MNKTLSFMVVVNYLFTLIATAQDHGLAGSLEIKANNQTASEATIPMYNSHRLLSGNGLIQFSDQAIENLEQNLIPHHDLGIIAMDPTRITLDNGANPEITIGNFGNEAESGYSGTLVIEGTSYIETIEVIKKITAGSDTTIEMPLWEPEYEGNYTGTAYLTISGDEYSGNDTLVTNLEVLDAIKGYGFVASGECIPKGPVSIILPFGTLTSIAENTDKYWAGADWVIDTWYAVEYSSRILLTVDKETGIPTIIGTMPGYEMTGLAYDVTTGTMYSSGYNEEGSVLYTVDLASAATEPVGVGISAGLIVGLSCDTRGNLYGIDMYSDKLLSIDKITGNATAIGSLGFNANYAQDMAFDRDNDILYGTLFSNLGSGGLYQLDLTTGTAYLLDLFDSQITGFAIPYTPELHGYKVMFHVYDEASNLIEDVTIKINSTTISVSNGSADFYLGNGTFDYEVKSDGFQPVKGTIEVNGSDVSEDVTLYEVLGIDDLNINVSIYPNPSNGIFIITTDQEYSLEVFNTAGEVIFTQELTTNRNQLNLEQSAGIYILRLTNGAETIFSKMIIE